MTKPTLIPGKTFYRGGVPYLVETSEDICVHPQVPGPPGFSRCKDDPYRFYYDPDKPVPPCSGCRGL